MDIPTPLSSLGKHLRLAQASSSESQEGSTECLLRDVDGALRQLGCAALDVESVRPVIAGVQPIEVALYFPDERLGRAKEVKAPLWVHNSSQKPWLLGDEAGTTVSVQLLPREVAECVAAMFAKTIDAAETETHRGGALSDGREDPPLFEKSLASFATKPCGIDCFVGHPSLQRGADAFPLQWDASGGLRSRPLSSPWASACLWRRRFALLLEAKQPGEALRHLTALPARHWQVEWLRLHRLHSFALERFLLETKRRRQRGCPYTALCAGLRSALEAEAARRSKFLANSLKRCALCGCQCAGGCCIALGCGSSTADLKDYALALLPLEDCTTNSLSPPATPAAEGGARAAEDSRMKALLLEAATRALPREPFLRAVAVAAEAKSFLRAASEDLGEAEAAQVASAAAAEEASALRALREQSAATRNASEDSSLLESPFLAFLEGAQPVECAWLSERGGKAANFSKTPSGPTDALAVIQVHGVQTVAGTSLDKEVRHSALSTKGKGKPSSSSSSFSVEGKLSPCTIPFLDGGCRRLLPFGDRPVAFEGKTDITAASSSCCIVDVTVYTPDLLLERPPELGKQNPCSVTQRLALHLHPSYLELLQRREGREGREGKTGTGGGVGSEGEFQNSWKWRAAAAASLLRAVWTLREGQAASFLLPVAAVTGLKDSAAKCAVFSVAVLGNVSLQRPSTLFSKTQQGASVSAQRETSDGREGLPLAAGEGRLQTLLFALRRQRALMQLQKELQEFGCALLAAFLREEKRPSGNLRRLLSCQCKACAATLSTTESFSSNPTTPPTRTTTAAGAGPAQTAADLCSLLRRGSLAAAKVSSESFCSERSSGNSAAGGSLSSGGNRLRSLFSGSRERLLRVVTAKTTAASCVESIPTTEPSLSEAEEAALSTATSSNAEAAGSCSSLRASARPAVGAALRRIRSRSVFRSKPQTAALDKSAANDAESGGCEPSAEERLFAASVSARKSRAEKVLAAMESLTEPSFAGWAAACGAETEGLAKEERFSEFRRELRALLRQGVCVKGVLLKAVECESLWRNLKARLTVLREALWRGLADDREVPAVFELIQVEDVRALVLPTHSLPRLPVLRFSLSSGNLPLSQAVAPRRSLRPSATATAMPLFSRGFDVFFPLADALLQTARSPGEPQKDSALRAAPSSSASCSEGDGQTETSPLSFMKTPSRPLALRVEKPPSALSLFCRSSFPFVPQCMLLGQGNPCCPQALQILVFGFRETEFSTLCTGCPPWANALWGLSFVGKTDEPPRFFRVEAAAELRSESLAGLAETHRRQELLRQLVLDAVFASRPSPSAVSREPPFCQSADPSPGLREKELRLLGKECLVFSVGKEGFALVPLWPSRPPLSPDSSWPSVSALLPLLPRCFSSATLKAALRRAGAGAHVSSALWTLLGTLLAVLANSKDLASLRRWGVSPLDCEALLSELPLTHKGQTWQASVARSEETRQGIQKASRVLLASALRRLVRVKAVGRDCRRLLLLCAAAATEREKPQGPNAATSEAQSGEARLFLLRLYTATGASLARSLSTGKVQIFGRASPSVSVAQVFLRVAVCAALTDPRRLCEELWEGAADSPLSGFSGPPSLLLSADWPAARAKGWLSPATVCASTLLLGELFASEKREATEAEKAAESVSVGEARQSASGLPCSLPVLESLAAADPSVADAALRLPFMECLSCVEASGGGHWRDLTGKRNNGTRSQGSPLFLCGASRVEEGKGQGASEAWNASVMSAEFAASLPVAQRPTLAAQLLLRYADLFDSREARERDKEQRKHLRMQQRDGFGLQPRVGGLVLGGRRGGLGRAADSLFLRTLLSLLLSFDSWVGFDGAESAAAVNQTASSIHKLKLARGGEEAPRCEGLEGGFLRGGSALQSRQSLLFARIVSASLTVVGHSRASREDLALVHAVVYV